MHHENAAMQQSCGFQPFGAVRACVFACLFALLLGACAKDAPELAVKRQIEALQAAIEARDAGDIEALLAQDFVGNNGMGARDVRRMAAGVFLRDRNVSARIGPVDVAVRGDASATASFTVLATGGSGGLLPERGQVFNVETGWRLDDGEWRLVSAKWTPRL